MPLCYNGTRSSATVAISDPGARARNLEVLPAHFALPGGALRLRDLVMTPGVRDARTVPPHHEPAAPPQSARRFCAKYSEYISNS